MKTKKSWLFLVGILAAGVMAGGLMAEDQDEKPIHGSIAVKENASYAGLAKISEKQATEAALKAIPGTVSKTTLKEEDGFLIFEVKINGADKKPHEALVDAGTGKVLKSEIEDEDEDEGHNEKEKD